MATLDSIQAAFDRAEREQKIRDEGLRRAFDILCGAIERNQNTLKLIHEAVTEGPPSSPRLLAAVERIKDLLKAQPGAIADAVRDALDDRDNPFDPDFDDETERAAGP